MKPKEFVKTLYLGDRGCKEIRINGWDNRVSVKVDLISRIRDSSGNWNFYADEDIKDGLIVFTGVKSILFSPPGYLPNDIINYLEWVKSDHDFSTFRFSIDSIKPDATSEEVTVEIQASGIHLEDPNKPGVKIHS